MKKLLMPTGWLLRVALVAALMTLFACTPSEDKSKMNLDKGMVRVDIDGHRFDVPLRYMYSNAVASYGRWPTPKKEVSKVGSLSLSVLLPDLRPYYKEDDARWKEKGHGDKVEVSVAIPPGGLAAWQDWFEGNVRRTNQFSSEGRFYKKEPDIHGLTHFSGKKGDDYFAQDGQKLAITCDKSEPPENLEDFWSPSCKVKSNFRPGLVLEYYYALKYLPRWKEIDADLKTIFDGFAQATSTTK